MTTGIPWLDEKAENALKVQQENPGPYAIRGYEGEINMSRVLVRAAHGLNLNQKRLIMYAVSKIHPFAEQPNQLVIRISALEYAKEMNLIEARNFYRGLREASDSLFNRYISIAYETPTGKRIEKIHWVSSANYHEGEGWVELRFSPEVSPYLSMLKSGNRINYKLQLAIDLKSVYSWRLLELLMQWKDTKKLYIALEDFRHSLEIPDTYRYTDIRIHCIEKPRKELEERLGIKINWHPIKESRAVKSLQFSWKDAEQIEMDLIGGDAAKPAQKRNT